MRKSSLRFLSSAWARSMRREKTSGEREGSWEGSMRNAEFGMRNRRPTVQFRIPHSAFRIGYAATAPATLRNSRRFIVLAPPASAAYIIRPPESLEGIAPHELRGTHRAARRQAPQGQLSLGPRDRHPLRRLQSWRQGERVERYRGSGRAGRIVRRDRRGGWVPARRRCGDLAR